MRKPAFSRRTGRLLAVVMAAMFVSTTPHTALSAVATPPPVSGRPLSDPEGILPADVLARVELLRANVDLLRRYMGVQVATPPLLRGRGAQPAEVYSQALNLEVRANRLAFEQVRVIRNDAMALTGETLPADVFAVVDSALASVLLVKQDMRIKTAIGEVLQPASSTPTDVFNAVVAAGAEINNLLQERTSPSDVFQLVTAAVHTAAALHATIPGGGYLPEEPAFEANKMPADVLQRMRQCYQLVSRLARAKGVNTLQLEFSEERSDQVSPNDVSDMAALLLEQLADTHRRFPEARAPARAYYPGKRFPSHVYQRAGLLEAILEEVVDAFAHSTTTPAAEG